jgi:hypothetical protein
MLIQSSVILVVFKLLAIFYVLVAVTISYDVTLHLSGTISLTVRGKFLKLCPNNYYYYYYYYWLPGC